MFSASVCFAQTAPKYLSYIFVWNHLKPPVKVCVCVCVCVGHGSHGTCMSESARDWEGDFAIGKRENHLPSKQSLYWSVVSYYLCLFLKKKRNCCLFNALYSNFLLVYFIRVAGEHFVGTCVVWKTTRDPPPPPPHSFFRAASQGVDTQEVWIIQCRSSSRIFTLVPVLCLCLCQIDDWG